MFTFDKTENGYMASIIERVVAERSKEVDGVILGEIRRIAIDNEIETKIILNEKNVVEALRNYQDGYKRIKAEIAREIFEEIEKISQKQIEVLTILEGAKPIRYEFFEGGKNAFVILNTKLAELKKKYTGGDE